MSETFASTWQQPTRADRHLLTSTGFECDLITREVRNWYHRDNESFLMGTPLLGGRGKGAIQLGRGSVLSTGRWHSQLQWPLRSHHKLFVTASSRTGLWFTGLHTLPCFIAPAGTYPSPPSSAPDVGTEPKQSTNWACGFDEKYNSHGEGLGLLAWHGREKRLLGG